jgi:hypothetical protein
VFAEQPHRSVFSKIMENYKILNPEKAPSWMSPMASSGFGRPPKTKAGGIAHPVDGFRSLRAALIGNQTPDFWGTNIAICTRIGKEPLKGEV